MAKEWTDTQKKAGTGCCTVPEQEAFVDPFGGEHAHEEGEGSSKLTLLRLVAAGAMLIGGMILKPTGRTELILYLIIYLIAGYDILWTAIRNILKGDFLDENFLMTIASIGAMIIGEHPEAAGVMVFYQLGEFFQDLAVNNSRKQIKSLLKIKPEFANLKTENGVMQVRPESVEIGDVILIKAGEKVPLDGVVLDGASSMDTSALTGESMPQDVTVGSDVLSGSINQTGVLSVRVSKAYKDSTVAKILYLVENASAKKATTESFITKFAKIYTPIVVGCAAAIAVIPSLILHGALTADWFYRGLVFLVVSCPCALVLSIPLGYFGGLGCASKHGILIKGGNYLEALANAEIAVFDKTGTLTKGSFHLDEILPQPGVTKEQLLLLAAHGEHFSNHPIARSVTDAFQGTIDESAVTDYSEVPGKGIRMRYNGREVLLGNDKLLLEHGVPVEVLHDRPGTVLYLALAGKQAGSLVISDEVKPDAVEAVRTLKEIGVLKTVMLTGDNATTAQFVQKKVGLDEVHAGLLPQDKVGKVEELFMGKSPKGKLLFVGDGINDAPVLMRADVGFAMGGVGSDAAIESADVVIMNDAPKKVPDAIRIAKKTRQIVWQNIIFALGVKALVMVLSVAVRLPMAVAIFADVGVALICVLNATRTLAFKVR